MWERSLLGLCLFGDILNGEALLADDGSHKLSRHEYTQGEIELSWAWSTKVPWGPRLRGALIPGRPTSTPRAGSLVRRSSIHVHNIWHLERVVFELVFCQLLNSSGDGTRDGGAGRIMMSTLYRFCYFLSKILLSSFTMIQILNNKMPLIYLLLTVCI